MPADPRRLPLPKADQLAREQIEHHRAEMSRWRQLRAERLATERSAGMSVAEIAQAIGVHEQVVYELLRTAKGR
jgi:hypothetical protein